MSRREGAGNIPAALALGLGAGMVVTLIGAAVTAWLIQGQMIGEGTAGIAAMVTVLLGSAAAALAAAGKVPQLRLAMCLGGGGIYLVGLLCCGALLFDGIRSGVAATAAVAAGGCLGIYLLGMGRKRKPKYRVPKLR